MDLDTVIHRTVEKNQSLVPVFFCRTMCERDWEEVATSKVSNTQL